MLPGLKALALLDFRQTTPPTCARFMFESKYCSVSRWLYQRRRYVSLTLCGWHLASDSAQGSANHRPIQVPLCRQYPRSDPRVVEGSSTAVLYSFCCFIVFFFFWCNGVKVSVAQLPSHLVVAKRKPWKTNHQLQLSTPTKTSTRHVQHKRTTTNHGRFNRCPEQPIFFDRLAVITSPRHASKSTSLQPER
jgi:hypothetical protein